MNPQKSPSTWFGSHGIAGLMVFCATFLTPVRSSWAAEDKITFNDDVRPILSDNCFACHGTDEKKRKGGLRLDVAEGAYRANDDGVVALEPGDLAKSELWQRITSNDPDEIMPPPKSHKAALSTEQRAVIRRWIEQGAVYQKHWAYEPVHRPDFPSIRSGDTHPVDRFISAKLTTHDLTLAPEAQREVLLRRVTLDLTGLPPTMEEINAFMADQSPDAYERVVDRLLASPRYGEHLGRDWLDAVRYADTHGMHFDNERTIWPYRDWVVRAFNENLPFDQFTITQLAGDLLPNPTQDQLIASGYNRCQLTTNEGGSIEDEVLARYTSDRTDTTMGVWLGLTANCATCHDHKFDPLKQREYYQLGAFFRGLSDRTFDANARVPGPFILVADEVQRNRVHEVAAAASSAMAKLSAQAEKLASAQPALTSKPITYEVVWAEDGDIPTAEDFSGRKQPGEWREGDGVPVASGHRALRLEGHAEREIKFGANDIHLVVRTALRAFAHVNLDPANPPRAIGMEFIDADHKAKRIVWGDAKALGPNVIAAGPLPLPGSYVHLEIDALAAGLEKGAVYTGVHLLQSDGNAWWDHIGTVCTSPSAAEDPLLSVKAWKRDYGSEELRTASDLPLDVKYSIRLADYFQKDDDRNRLAEYHRNFIYGPLRDALETEARTARQWLAEKIHWEKTLPATLVSREMAEPHPAYVLVRGQYDKRGDQVGPATPAFLPPLQHESARPTRLDLAHWIVARENPLTARVAVNRLWQHCFGAGLVRTPGDFGAQGDPPSHRELLDWLASEFVDSGWNVKHLVRLLVTSRTYRQESRATPQLIELDPANRLLARGPRFRLDGEVLRDQALFLGGLLQPKIGGPPARPYQPENVWEPVAIPTSNTRVYQRDTGPALYRRSIYTFWKRTAPPPSLLAFDAPSREAFCLRRERTDTPLQALALMNDVQQIEAARAFAERLLTSPGDDDARLALGFQLATSRPPIAAERTLLGQALATQRTRFQSNTDAAKKLVAVGESKPTHDLPPSELAAWTLVTNLLLNLDETVTRN